MCRILVVLSAFLALAPAFPAEGQTPASQGCRVTLIQELRGDNIFSEQQEIYLADVIAEHVQQRYRLIEDESLVGPLQRIGQRLVQFLPPARTPYKFFLLDTPETNAFASAGGRVYVTRRMISAARSEDEL
ncbi:MAG TPA: M48 family metalloprotease, partial [Candidatus Nitrosotenuis sp.]|nr:M48 family metalloprotease [Candidatus Nitrosotenuis sp.]